MVISRRPLALVPACSVLIAAAALSACNQSTPTGSQSQAAPTAQALPPPPAPPPVPRYHRSVDQEARWQRYLEARQAYEADLARARAQGRAEQSYVDQGQQAQAFDAGRRDQAASDQWSQTGAFNAGRSDQAAQDRWRQAGAFSAGRVDQARIDQAERDVNAAYHQAQLEPDPHHKAQIIAQARAELAAAQHGQ